MKCINCGKEIKNDALFCPACGSKQNADDNTIKVTPAPVPPPAPRKEEKAVKAKVYNEKEYFKNVEPKRITHNRVIGLILSVVLILCSVALCVALWIGVTQISSMYNTYDEKSELLEEFFDDPESLSESEEEELLEAFDMSESDFKEFYSKYKSDKSLNYSDINDYITTDVLVMFALAETNMAGTINSIIIILYAFAAVVSLLCFVISFWISLRQ